MKIKNSKLFKYPFVLLTYLIFSLSSTSSITSQTHADLDGLKKIFEKENVHSLQYEIIHVYPHDKSHFTEGLKFCGDELFESIGLYGQSQLKKIDLETGHTLQAVTLPRNMFAEGITVMADKIYQLTYQEKNGFIYDKTTFKVLKLFYFTGQGWGLTNDGINLIMSNGSDTISFLDPTSFITIKKINVHINEKKIQNVNELEHVKNYIFANILFQDIIIVFSKDTGQVVAYLDIRKLRPANCNSLSCPANGIAYQKNKDTFLVTGKYWPFLYQIRLKEAEH